MKIVFSSNNVKVPFHVLAIEVEKMYNKDFDFEQDMLISEHCELISEFIKSCGWTEEEYMYNFYNSENIGAN